MGKFVWMLLLLAPCAVWAQASPTIGFYAYRLEGQANAEVLLSPGFLKRSLAHGEITAVTGATLTLSSEELDQVIPGACHVQVQSGSHGGLVSKVLGVAGTDLLLESSVEGVLEIGDSLTVHPFWTLREMFAFEELGTGETPEESDLVTLIDPTSQVSRSYFLKEGVGWREVGNEAAGDQADVAFPFYQGFFFLRRSPELLNVFVAGRIPFLPHRFQPIYPGRNLIAVALLGESDLAQDYFFAPGESPFPVHGGPSAADADVIALSSISRVLPRYYYHQSEGWKVIGLESLVSGPSLPLTTAADYHRVGPEDFLKVNSLQYGPVGGAAGQQGLLAVSSAGTVSEDTVEISGPAAEIAGQGADIGTLSESPSSKTEDSIGPSPGVGSRGSSEGENEVMVSWVEGSPVPFEGGLQMNEGVVGMRLNWDSEIGRHYGIQFRTVSAEAWRPVSSVLTANDSDSGAIVELVTGGGEFRVVELPEMEVGS